MLLLDQNLFKPLKILEVRSFRLPGGRPRPRFRKTSSMVSFSSLPGAWWFPGPGYRTFDSVQNLLSNIIQPLQKFSDEGTPGSALVTGCGA